MKKIFIIIFLSIVLILLINNISNASFADISIWEQAKIFIQEGQQGGNSIQNGQYSYSYWSRLAGVLWGVGIWIIIISGMILGISFMISPPDKKADLKKGLMIWGVGTGVILGALTIWKTAISILDIF